MKYSKEQLEGIAEEVVRKYQTDKNVTLKKSQHEVKEGAIKETLDTLHQAETKDERVIKFQKAADDLFTLDAVLSVDKKYSGIKNTKLYKSFRNLLQDSEFSKAMIRATSGEGAEWLPTDFSNQLIQKVQLNLRVAAMFDRIAMPSDPFKIPQKSAFSITYLGGTEATVPGTESFMGTANVTLTTGKLINWVPVSYELDEDSVIAMMPEIQWDIANSLARAQENACINGNSLAYTLALDAHVTSGGAFAATSQEQVFGGFRDYCIRNDNATTPLTLDISDSTYGTNENNLSKLLAGTSTYRGTNKDWFWICSVIGEHYLRSLKTAGGLPVMMPIYSAGANASINNAAVNEIYGIPVVVSEFMRDNLNAYGYDDHTGGYGATKYTTLLLVRRDAWTFGDRRKLLVETFRNVIYQKTDLVASMRVAFQYRYPAGDPFTRMGVKLATF
jgi:hypothetical protein